MITPIMNWETLRTFDSSTLDGTYQAFGNPLAHPSVILKLVNNSDVTVTISKDASTDIDVAPAGSFWLYDLRKSEYNETFPANSQIYLKGSAGTGTIYLVTLFLENRG